MTVDPETLRAYAERASTYRDLVSRDSPDADLPAFLDDLTPRACVLDWGCGPGNSAVMLQAAGHTVEATDASPEMVALACEAGVASRVASFDDLTDRARYDGIWANFSLLHASRVDLPRHLGAAHTALIRGGLLHLGMKTGTGERRDALGRLYTYVTVDELTGLLADAGFRHHALREDSAVGLTGEIK